MDDILLEQQRDEWRKALAAACVQENYIETALAIAEGVFNILEETDDDTIENVFGFGDHNRGYATIVAAFTVAYTNAALKKIK